MAHIIENLDDFNKLTEKGITLIDFYADWCGPCRMLAPVIEQISDLYKNKINVIKVNTDAFPELAGAFGVRSIPTLVLIKEKQILKQDVGYKTLSQLQEWINPIL